MIRDLKHERLVEPLSRRRLKLAQTPPVVERLVPLESIERVRLGVGNGDPPAALEQLVGIARRRLCHDHDRRVMAAPFVAPSLRRSVASPQQVQIPARDRQPNPRVRNPRALDRLLHGAVQRLALKRLAQPQRRRGRDQPIDVLHEPKHARPWRTAARHRRQPCRHGLEQPNPVLKPRIKRGDLHIALLDKPPVEKNSRHSQTLKKLR